MTTRKNRQRAHETVGTTYLGVDVLVSSVMKNLSQVRNRGQIIMTSLCLLFIFLFSVLAASFFIQPGWRQPPAPGNPQKDPVTGLYTVYVLVYGHRQRTILHRNLHANIFIDQVSCYYSRPSDPPSGWSLTDFSKRIEVTVSVTNTRLSVKLENDLSVSVALGASWGRVLTYSLPSGTYKITAQGVDEDGFQSSATASLVLP